MPEFFMSELLIKELWLANAYRTNYSYNNKRQLSNGCPNSVKNYEATDQEGAKVQLREAAKKFLFLVAPPPGLVAIGTYFNFIFSS